MADLKDLQQKLNTDQALKQRFLQEPGKVLSEHGVTLDNSQLEKVKKQIQAQAAGANANAVSVGVSVGI